MVRKIQCLLCFNSIKVRLIHFDAFFVPYRILFQFHKGSINTKRQARRYSNVLRFNSIKVRLIHAGMSPAALSGFKFQFHKGSINTLGVSLTPP